MHGEMKKAGFEKIINYIPDGEVFWRFLKSVSEEGACVSCQAGSGYPTCPVRICAKEKNVEICALCRDYPCEKFAVFFESYPMLKGDNELLRENGIDGWLAVQAERRASGFVYNG